jgi:ubiquinone/menaquinone biosynthesis C-methylase UbiE
MNEQNAPSPELFLETITGYQKAAALRAALELKIFSAIGQGERTAAEIAGASRAAERGIRILADYLTVYGFLMKQNGKYRLTPSSALFLDEKSPAYAGGAAEFLMSEELSGAFNSLTAAVRKGGEASSKGGTVSANNPVWLAFARTMGGLMFPAAQGLAEMLALDASKPAKVLDVAAGHGIWGISVAKKYPKAELVALDWPPVLEIARQNAERMGVGSRFKAIAGNAFEVELGSDYDVILVPNFLHHFNRAQCVEFLRKCQRALRAGGRVVIVEFVPNEDRVTPPPAATFSLVMLATTPEGDAYTFGEYGQMLKEAGFQNPTTQALPSSANTAVIAKK